MSTVQMLLALKKQRLTAAAEDIFVLFEKTMAEYEEELCRSKEKNERLQKLLDSVVQPQLRIRKADVQQLVVVTEKVLPERQEWSSNLDQEDPESPPDIKQEQEELWSSQMGEELQELEEADITKSAFTPVPVKSEDDEEKLQSLQLHQRQAEHMETGTDGEEGGGQEPARNSDPESSLQPKTEHNTEDSSEPDTEDSSEPDTEDSSDTNTEDSSEPDTEDSADWKETKESASGSNSLINRQLSVSDSRCSAGKKVFDCSVCTKSFTQSGNLKAHMRIHTGEKIFDCSVCTKYFTQSGSLKTHMRIHTGEKPFDCSVCTKSFTQSGSLKTHMRIHTGEKPFDCVVCTKSFTLSGSLKKHMRIHTGEKPFDCVVCTKSFTQSGSLKKHMRIHTGEKPFDCVVCTKSFTLSRSLKKHMRIHTGEKPFSCSVCEKGFTRRSIFKRHKCVGLQPSLLQSQSKSN
ncbi:zinc finger protein 32-like [Eleginops maclovinus]|uniref:zinc finger protein 32-like n=1 Tax=Eleginops maclovinus TaxID=56733 RepID=UPI0030803291